MNKILSWFERYHNPIGYTIGGLNLVSGLTSILTGDVYTGGLNLAIGVYITVDTWAFRAR